MQSLVKLLTSIQLFGVWPVFDKCLYIAHNCNACFYNTDTDSLLLLHFKDASLTPLRVVLAVYSPKYWVQLCLACDSDWLVDHSYLLVFDCEKSL